MKVPNTELFTGAFTQGNGVEVSMGPADLASMQAELAEVGDFLGGIPIEPSFSWSDKFPRRRSGWIARIGDGPFASTEEAMADFDGNPEAGQVGLAMLADVALRETVTRLANRADLALQAAAAAIGIPDEYMERCSTRYRIIRYEGQQGGIGVHYDGNALSAVQTNAPGLRELRYDGDIHAVDPDTVSVMSGSSVYQASEGGPNPLLPAFHSVQLEDGDYKTSVAAFWNFPDMELVPADVLGTPFYHDVGNMKELDGPDGPRAHLWQRVANAHGLSVPEFVHIWQ